jgi:hypothetical protein
VNSPLPWLLNEQKLMLIIFAFLVSWFTLGTFFSVELFKMVCEVNETDVKIGIASVMLPQDAGASLEKYLTSSSSGLHFSIVMYSLIPLYQWHIWICLFISLDAIVREIVVSL